MTRKHSWISFAGAFALVFATALNAQAGLSAVGQWFSGQQNKLSDNSAEYLFNRVLGPGGSTSTLEVGDVLVTGFQIATVEDTTGGGGTNGFGGGGVNFLTGIAVIEVSSVTIVPPGPGLPLGAALFTFSPLSAAAKADLATGVPVAGTSPSALVAAEVATWSAGTMVTFYDDMTDNFVRVPTPGTDDGAPDIGTGPFVTENAMLAAAINGTRILEIGVDTNATTLDFWTAQTNAASVDVAVLSGLPAGINNGTVNFSLGLTAAPSGAAAGWIFGVIPSANPLTGAGGVNQFVGNGNVQGILTGPGSTTANTPFDIFDDLNVNFAPVHIAPEASSLVIWSGLAGVVGLAAWRRRRKV